MAKTKEQKQAALDGIKSNVERAKSVVFTDYTGMKMTDFDALRSIIRAKDGKIEVSKITLSHRAFDENPMFMDIVGKTPFAIAYGFSDEVSVPKAIKQFAKGKNTLKILGGYYEGAFVTRDQMLMLADTPSKEELIAKMLGSLNAPLRNVHGALRNFGERLVYVLKAIENK